MILRAIFQRSAVEHERLDGVEEKEYHVHGYRRHRSRSAPEPGLAHLTLTQTQQVVLEFIKHDVNEHHHSPLIREIPVGCYIPSYTSAIDRLIALERNGYLARTPNKPRSITLVPQSVESAPRGVESPPLQGAV